MSETSWADTVRQVHERARFRCEYCQTAQSITGQAMHVDHIHPDAGDDLDNLCLSCAGCNMSKGRATSAVDPETGERVSLFNPRAEKWSDHFAWTSDGIVLTGLTSVARATIQRLRINRDRMLSARANWVAYGLHPPK